MQVRGTGEAGMSEQRPGFEEPSSRPRAGGAAGRCVSVLKKEQTLRSDLGRKSVAQGTCRAGSARETPLPRPAQAACSGAAFRPVGAQPWEDTGFFRFAPSPPGPAAAPTGRLHAHAPSCFRPLAGVWMLAGPKQIFSSLRLLGLRRGLRGHRTARWLTSGARGLRATLRPSRINATSVGGETASQPRSGRNWPEAISRLHL